MLQATAGKMEKCPPSIAKQPPIQIWYRTLDCEPYSCMVNARSVKKKRMMA